MRSDLRPGLIAALRLLAGDAVLGSADPVPGTRVRDPRDERTAMLDALFGEFEQMRQHNAKLKLQGQRPRSVYDRADLYRWQRWISGVAELSAPRLWLWQMAECSPRDKPYTVDASVWLTRFGEKFDGFELHYNAQVQLCGANPGARDP